MHVNAVRLILCIKNVDRGKSVYFVNCHFIT